MYILAGSKEASVESTGESTEVGKAMSKRSLLSKPCSMTEASNCAMQTDFEAAARDAKRRRIHDAEMAWVQVRPSLQCLDLRAAWCCVELNAWMNDILTLA